MKKFIFSVLTLLSAVLCFAPVFAEEEYRYIDAEEAGESPVPIYGRYYNSEEEYSIVESGYFITADSSGNYVYITDKEGSRLLEDKFKCVYNLLLDDGNLIVRYYGTTDFSGFAILNSDFEAEFSRGNFYYFSFRGDKSYSDPVTAESFIGVKRDSEGVLQAAYYNSEGDYKITSGKNSVSISLCTEFILKELNSANEAGLLPRTLGFKNFTEPVTRYDLTSLAVEAVLEKEGTDIFTYIRKNNINVDYEKYLDVVSSDVAAAEALGLIRPADGKYFNPDEKITRQEAAYTLNRLCEIFDVPVTPYSETFSDDSQIEDWAKEAVYNVSGTPAADSYIMAPAVLENLFKPGEEYTLERAAAAIWRISRYDTAGLDTTARMYNKIKVGEGLMLFQGTEGKWGVCREEDEKVITEPLYEVPATGIYKMNRSFFGIALYFKGYAANGAYTLTDKPDEHSAERDNTYYVFNTDGELIKKIHYGSEEMGADLHETQGKEFHVSYTTGSNLVFSEVDWYEDKQGFEFIKRLVSEAVVTGYSGIGPGEIKGEFEATENKTQKLCTLNPDGSFKEYIEE